MTARAAHLGEIHPLGPPVCAEPGGCSYLRTLSALEHIAGFDRAARSYAEAANQCREHGCWAAKAREEADETSGTGEAPVPLPARGARGGTKALAGGTPFGDGEAIAFSRSSLIDIVSDQDGNYVERRSLRLESLPGGSDPLGYLFRYWRDLRAATACRFSDIDTVHLTRAGVIGKVHVVDVSSPDPGDFSFELLGYALPLRHLQKPRAHPVSIYADLTLRDYNTTRLTAAPRLHRVRCRLGDTQHHYTRLILPFLSAQGLVERLLVAIRQEPGNGIRVEAGN